MCGSSCRHSADRHPKPVAPLTTDRQFDTSLTNCTPRTATGWAAGTGPTPLAKRTRAGPILTDGGGCQTHHGITQPIVPARKAIEPGHAADRPAGRVATPPACPRATP